MIFLYDEYEFEQARKIAKTTKKFVNLVDNQEMRLELMFNQIHYDEFYEENIEKACQLIQEAEALFHHFLIHKGYDKSPKEIIENSRIFLKDATARCLTKKGKYHEAISLFETYEFIIQDHITTTPLDLSLRMISKSYLAHCYFHVGRVEDARKLAREVVI